MKTCKSCGQTKPFEDFNKDPRNRGGYKHSCKVCVFAADRARRKAHPEVARAYYHRMMSDPENRARRNARVRARNRRHGMIAIEEIRRRSAAHKALAEAEKFALIVNRFAHRYGEPFANFFQAHPFAFNSKDGYKALRRLQGQFLKSEHGITATDATLRRIISLNKIFRSPGLQIGWRCMACGLTHRDPFFFDIDHILPRKDGGANHTDNLQCLCPNCHRKKTLAIDGTSPRQSFRILIQGTLDPILAPEPAAV